MIRTLKTFLHICVAIYSLWRASKVTSTWELSALSAETARDKWNHMSNQNRWRHPGGARSLNELPYWLVCVRDSNVSADSANASFPQLNYAKCGSIKTRKLSCKQICHRWREIFPSAARSVFGTAACSRCGDEWRKAFDVSTPPICLMRESHECNLVNWVHSTHAARRENE